MRDRWVGITMALCITVSIVFGLTRTGRELPVGWSLEHDSVWRSGGVPSAPPTLDPEQRSKIIELARNATTWPRPAYIARIERAAGGVVRESNNEEVIQRVLKSLPGPVTMRGWRVVREEYGRYAVAFAYEVPPGQRRPRFALEVDPKTGDVAQYWMQAWYRQEDVVMLWFVLLLALMFVVATYVHYYVFLFGFDRGTPRMPVRSVVMQRLAERHVSRFFPHRFRSQSFRSQRG